MGYTYDAENRKRWDDDERVEQREYAEGAGKRIWTWSRRSRNASARRFGEEGARQGGAGESARKGKKAGAIH
jgi:hypothetical protein